MTERGTDRVLPPTGFGFTATLALVMGVSTFMLAVIGVLGPFIIEHHDLTRTHLGLLASLVPLSGGILSPSAGAIVDRFGGRRLTVVLSVTSGASLLLLAGAPTFAWLMVAACLSGLAFAIGNPATNHLIATHTAPGRQGVIVGVKQSGVQIASFAVGATLPSLALLFGWRVAAMSAASLALLTLGLTFGVVPRDLPGPSRRPDDVARRRAAVRPSWPAIRYLAGYAFLMGAGTSAAVTYLPLYAFERVGLTVAAAGAAASAMAGVAVFTRIGWARLAERSWDTTRVLLAIAALGITSLLVVIAAAAVPPLLWVGAIGLGSSAIAWNGVAMLFVVRGAPPGLSGRFTGHVQLAFSLGMFSSPLLFGALVDRTGSYTPGWGIAIVATVAAGACVLAGRRALVPAEEPDVRTAPAAPDR